MTKQLLPIRGTWVKIENRDEPGVVRELKKDGEDTIVLVWWLKAKINEWIEPEKLKNGFLLGMSVQDVPLSRTRNTLGEGIVLENRIIGNKEQVLVEFPELGQRHWLPFQNLKQIKGIEQRFCLEQTGESGNAERFRMRSLAYAIDLWNENTGSLSTLNIDPLPHQIHLVHHILASGNLNWLIADDVGLGKTIEAGMILSALIRKKSFRRILLITPAGLVKQWKDELHYKFDLNKFQIFGEDFHINESRHWMLYNHVIGSVDRLKSDKNMATLMQAGDWDLVIFDEAQNLSRNQYGMKYHSTDRFRLSAALRKKTDSILLLSATPHQGKQDKFQALLEIIRPELKKSIQTLSLNPEILGQMVIRNNKADVTDAEGNFIFQGKIVRAIPITLSEEEKSFEQHLLKYLRNGYAAGERKGGNVGRAIGFVMTIYRKLAASSTAAIKMALSRRLKRLIEDFQNETDGPDLSEEIDLRYVGEWEEDFGVSGKEFFAGEIQTVKSLIEKAEKLLESDSKSNIFIDHIITAVLNKNPNEKIVIFTEYRATQNFLKDLFDEKYRPGKTFLIHGGQKHDERAKAIESFEETGQFLISTEAGGEGINLHRECHLMVNYDLPWNPMRLVQRIGRLYRYGQNKKVIVFNVHIPQTIDGSIMELLYTRIDQVVQDMATLGGEYQPGLEAEILGEIAEFIDIKDILENAIDINIKHTKENIEDALNRAKEAVKKQRDLLKYAAGFNPDETKGELSITKEHLNSFVMGMIAQLNIKIIETTHKGAVWKLDLPDTIRNDLTLRNQTIIVTLDRDIAARRKNIHMMDFNFHLFNYFLKAAMKYSFDGRVCRIKDLDGSALIMAILRWQNDQGIRMRQEYLATLVKENGENEQNSKTVSNWLNNSAQDGQKTVDTIAGETLLDSVKNTMDQRLDFISNNELHPEYRQIVSAAWCSQE